MTDTPTQSLLLYDGLCGFCDRTIQFIEAHERNHTMQFATLQGEFAEGLFKKYPAFRGVDSLIVVQVTPAENALHLLVRSDAVIAIGQYLGGPWRAAAALLRLIPRPVRDRGYDAIAKRRFRIFGRLDACRIPSAQERARFRD